MQTTDIKEQVRELEHRGNNLGKHLVNLVQAHCAKFENEILDGTKRLRINFLLCLMTVALSIGALLVLAIALSELLLEFHPATFSRGGALALVGGVVALCAILCGILTEQKTKEFSIYPEKSMASFKETAECLLSKL